MLLRNVQVLGQLLLLLLIDVAGQLQTHRIQLTPLFEQLLHDAAEVQILIVDIIGIDIRISGHPDHGLFPDLVARIELGYKMQDQLFGEHEAALPIRNLDETLEYRIEAGHDTDFFLLVLSRQQHHRIEGAVMQEGEGLLLAHDHRGQVGTDGGIEVGFQLRLLQLGQLLEVDDANALGLQLAHQLLVNSCLPLLLQLHLVHNGCHLLGAGHIGLVLPHLLAGLDLHHQGAHPDHEELIEVRLVNGGEGQALRQGNSGIPRLRQYTHIELQPGQLTILEIICFFYFCILHTHSQLPGTSGPCFFSPATPGRTIGISISFFL